MHLALALLLFAAQEAPPFGRVTIGEQQIDPAIVATREAREKLFEGYEKRKKVEPFIACYPRDRFHHYHTDGIDSIFDVVFITLAGDVVDVRRLAGENAKGVTSEKEAAYALFLQPGTIDQLKIKKGQHATLSKHFADAKAEDLVEMKIREGLSLRIEIAAKDRVRKRGYMHRDSISDGEGMIFCYDKEAYYSFWMKSTEVPLSAAFLKADGTVADIVERMEPRDLTSHQAKFRVLYGLEVPVGWFEKNKMKVSDKIEIPDAVKSIKADPY